MVGLRVIGFSLWVLVLACINPHRLKPMPQKPVRCVLQRPAVVNDAPRREFVALLNQFGNRLSEVVNMAEAKALLHFPDLRGQRVIVEHIRNPSRKISALGMPRQNMPAEQAFQECKNP